MRTSGLNRLYRRLIVKHFGGTRNFIVWFAAVLLTIYVIDSYILTKDRLTTFVNGPPGVVQMDQPTKKSDGAEKKEEPKVEVPIAAKPEVKPNEKNENQPPRAGIKSACGVECPAGKYAYRVVSGEGRDGTPTICFNDNYAMKPEKKNGHRGINMAVIDDKTMEVTDIRYFDTYVEEQALVRFLKLGIKDSNIILAASQDEASFNLKQEGKKWLHSYGSSIVDKLQFRDAFVLVGQRGLTHGSAIEKYSPRDKKEFADQAEVLGCLSSPIGVLNKVDIPAEAAGEAELPPGLKAGEALEQCGVSTKCDTDRFPVHVFSGKGNSEGPKICVSGKYVMASGLNDAGRGFNMVVVDPSTKSVVRVGHFDTYAEDSSNLEIFLEMLENKQIVIAVTHDDASKNLKSLGKKLLEGLGSSMIDRLGFRDAWMFVGQRGLKDHTTLEELEFSGPANGWPKPIDKKMCVPTEIVGTKIKPDPLANKNELRRKFCAKFDGYGDFCEVEHIDELLTPAPVADKAMENHPIFDIPVIVVPGLNHNAVRMQLETLLMNPGINPPLVTVMYDEKFDEPSALAEVFRYNSQKLESSTKYVQQMRKAIEKAWELNPNAKHLIVLEEEVILGPDFLNFMAQCLPAVEADDTLAGVSAWNENGYTETSVLPELAYRSQTFPGFGFLLKRAFYNKYMKGKMESCCKKRSWDTWSIDEDVKFDMLVPDVSRVYRRPYEGLSEQADFLANLLNRKRVTFKGGQQKLSNAVSLTSAAYTTHIESLVKSSSALETTHVEDCLQEKGLGFYIPESPGSPLAIYFEQSGPGDYHILRQLCRCFGLFYSADHDPRGVHKDMLRFSMKGKSLFFIGSASPFHKYMPSGYKQVSRKHS